jgi:hypothetical protein
MPHFNTPPKFQSNIVFNYKKASPKAGYIIIKDSLNHRILQGFDGNQNHLF